MFEFWQRGKKQRWTTSEKNDTDFKRLPPTSLREGNLTKTFVSRETFLSLKKQQ